MDVIDVVGQIATFQSHPFLVETADLLAGFGGGADSGFDFYDWDIGVV